MCMRVTCVRERGDCLKRASDMNRAAGFVRFQRRVLASAARALTTSSNPKVCKAVDLLLGLPVSPFKSVTFKSVDLPHLQNEEFCNTLTLALRGWHEAGVRAAWGDISIDQAHCFLVLDALDFQLHHTDANKKSVMFNKWLDPSRASTLPLFATHSIGVGGMVVDEQNRVLVVKERASDYVPQWKLPGGAADRHEDIPDTAIREVYEETGVRTEFVSMVAMRQLHGYRYGHSDLYYVCRLRPITTEIKMCEAELSACEWKPMSEYMACLREGSMNQLVAQVAAQPAAQVPSSREHLQTVTVSALTAPMETREWTRTEFKDSFRGKDRHYYVYHAPISSSL